MNSNKTKVVITGASGFLGRNLVTYLDKNDQYVIYALSSQSKILQDKNRYKNVKYYDKNAIFTDQDKLILENAIIVNCEFPRNSTGSGMADGLKYIQGVFLKAKECKAKAVINISSQSVYSAKREVAATEDTPACLETTYAVGKYATELMLESILQGTDIYYTNIRLASLIGPGFDQRIVNRFVKQALRGEDLAANIGTQIYGFLDVKDAVSGLTAMIHSDARDWEKVYNLGPKGGYTIEQIAQVVCQLSKFYCERSIKYSVKRTDEHSNSMIDSRLFYRNFKWEPKIKITESTEEILKKRLKRES